MQDERKRIHFHTQEKLGEIQVHVTSAADVYSCNSCWVSPSQRVDKSLIINTS